MISSGDPNSKVWLVGEALGPEEKYNNKPFVGHSGQELHKMLGEVGIIYNDCYACNVLDDVPPKGKIENCFYKAKEAATFKVGKVDGRYPNAAVLLGRNTLREAVGLYRPNLVIALGGTPLWALCGENGITKWRSSILEGVHKVKVIPTFNPAAVLRQWKWRYLVVQDLRRALHEAPFPEIRYPSREYILSPIFDQTMDFLLSIKDQKIIADTETWGRQIDCIGIAKSKNEVICIPFNSFKTPDTNYWTLEDEVTIVKTLRKVMKENGVVWQNCLYDMQYTMHDWGFIPNTTDDIMLMHHVCFSELPNSLQMIASLHCYYYRFWKDEGKKWNPIRDDVNQRWKYNCDDCAYTFEAFESLDNTVDVLKQREQYNFLMDLVPPVLRMMLRGIPINTSYKAQLSSDLEQAKASRSLWFNDVLGHDLNPDSNLQMKTLIYEDFKIKPVINKKTGNPAVDDKAIQIIKSRQPLLRPLLEVVEEYRSIRVFKSNFADALLGEDDRLRSAVNIGGTNTFRFSYSKDAFDGGCNMQTIPKGTEKD